MKRYIPYDVKFGSKVVGDKETIRVQGVMLEHPEGPYVNFTDVEHLITELETERRLSFRNQVAHLEAERDALVQALECLIEIEPEHCACDAPECRDMGERFAKARAAIDAARGNP